MQTSNETITVYYWPVRFRGNILKLILEEAMVKYESVSDYPTISKYIFLNED